jgi:hypothetical protein
MEYANRTRLFSVNVKGIFEKDKLMFGAKCFRNFEIEQGMF